MIAKFILYGPFAAMVSLVLTSVEGTQLEYSILEVFLLGKIPLTEIYLSFDVLLIVSVLIFWTLITLPLVKLVKKVQKKRISYNPKKLAQVAI